MTRYLMDSGIANKYIARHPKVYGRARAAATAGDRIGICVPILGELRGGIEASATRDANLRKLRADLGAWRIWPFDQPAAEEFGRLVACDESADRCRSSTSRWPPSPSPSVAPSYPPTRTCWPSPA